MQAKTLIPWATVKLLGPETEPIIGTPRVLLFHTMVGNLAGTYSMFRNGGFDGTESTFGVGGRWEPGGLDGALWQFQYLGYQADAQYAGNAYADSVETADGGNPNNPWTTAQLNTLIRLTVDWCKATGNPCQLVAHESDHGLGYHSQFYDWNTDHHTCPGAVRIGQLKTIVIPKARAILTGSHVAPVVVPVVKPDASPHLTVDGTWGQHTIVATQLACGLRGSAVDGVWGPGSRKAFQKHLGVPDDGDIGPLTLRAWRKRLRTQGFWIWAENASSQTWNPTLTAHHQRCLNAVKF